MQKANIIRFAVLTRLVTILVAVMTNFIEDYDRSAPGSKFIRWDAIYFLSIAKNGYQHEKEYAFFPGYPFLIYLLASITGGLGENSLIYSGMIISNLSFVSAALVLYYLGLELGFCPRSCYRAAIFFCLSPCSIFLSSVYTESLFCLVSFLGMLNYARGNQFRSCVWFTISATIRSNGLLFAGFFIWDMIKVQRGNFMRVKDFIRTAVVLTPFIGFQAVGYLRFCQFSERRPWCDNSIPIMYSFVQKHYWNNGFLNYWTIRQLPLFALGFPVFLLNFVMLKKYFQYDWIRISSFGTRERHSIVFKNIEFNNSKLLPFIYLTSFLLAYVTFFMHVQVILRFFTCLPCSYLFLGSCPKTYYRKTYVYYCVIWNIIGAVLFATFLPPA